MILNELISRCERVRTLKGIAYPTNLIPIDKYKCIVLCRRELRIYNLDSGAFLTKLKGVMNQKMPYYGLHDHKHLVALSRNRMYINLMNLETGECKNGLEKYNYILNTTIAYIKISNIVYFCKLLLIFK